MRRIRRAAAGMAAAAVLLAGGAAPAAPGPDEVAGDANKMINDGYVVIARQAPSLMTGLCMPAAPCVPVPAGNAGSAFVGYVLDEDGEPAELATLPDGRPSLHVTVFTRGDIGTFEGDHYVTAGGSHPGDQPLAEVRGVAFPGKTGTRMFVFRLPAVYGGETAFVSIWAGIAGYPAECVPVVVGADTCDGGALGFYNPLKSSFGTELLDAVPHPTILP